MEKEIQEIINKNLPAQVGEVLKERLKQADVLEEANKKLKEHYETLNIAYDGLNVSLSKYRELEELESSLNTLNDQLKERERVLEVTLLTLKLEEANKRSDLVVNFTLGLVRNVDVRKSILDSENQHVYNQSTGCTDSKNIVKSYTETETKG